MGLIIIIKGKTYQIEKKIVTDSTGGNSWFEYTLDLSKYNWIGIEGDKCSISSASKDPTNIFGYQL